MQYYVYSISQLQQLQMWIIRLYVIKKRSAAGNEIFSGIKVKRYKDKMFTNIPAPQLTFSDSLFNFIILFPEHTDNASQSICLQQNYSSKLEKGAWYLHSNVFFPYQKYFSSQSVNQFSVLIQHLFMMLPHHLFLMQLHFALNREKKLKAYDRN